MHIEKQIQDPLGSPLHAYVLSRHLHCRLMAPVRRTDKMVTFRSEIYFLCVRLTVAHTHSHPLHEQRTFALCSRCGPSLIGAELACCMRGERQTDRQAGDDGMEDRDKTDQSSRKRLTDRVGKKLPAGTVMVVHIQPQLHSTLSSFNRNSENPFVPILQSISPNA